MRSSNVTAKPYFPSKLWHVGAIKTVLIRKGVGVGEIDRGPGDQASDDIELGLLGEVVLGLMDRGI